LPPSGFSCSDQLPDDCDIYSIVEKQSQPVLISTSRQIRQMAFDIKHLAYDGPQRVPRGISLAVAGDPYQCASTSQTASRPNQWNGPTAFRRKWRLTAAY